MNKKIKVIELFELIFNNKQIPQKILYDNEEYVFNGESFVCCDHDTTPLLSEYNKSRLIDFLNDEVEILEEQEEIDIQNIKEENISYVLCDNDFESGEVKDILNNFFRENNNYIDTILRAVKQLDKKINDN